MVAIISFVRKKGRGMGGCDRLEYVNVVDFLELTLNVSYNVGGGGIKKGMPNEWHALMIGIRCDVA